MAEQPEVRYLGDVQRLSLGTGDVVVLKTEIRLTAEMADRIRAYMQDILGEDRKLLILCDGIEIGVLSPEVGA